MTLDDLTWRIDHGWIVRTLARLDLRDADLARQPADWVSRETAERRFRVTWCEQRAIAPDACHAPDPDDYDDDAALEAARANQRAAQEAWCAAKELRRGLVETCGAQFDTLESAFAAEWAEQRAGMLATLARPDMYRADLRGARARNAFLSGLRLIEARMEGADLRWARMEGADLLKARMKEAKLLEARMEGARLREARMERAILRGARMEGANLRLARMEGADLRAARMNGADLRDTRMQGADLRGARFRSAWLAGAMIGPSPVHSTDFSGAKGLTQSQLNLLIGDDDTILPPGLHVWSCWEQAPPGFDAMVKRAAVTADDPAKTLRADWLCSPTNPRRPVGRPAE